VARHQEGDMRKLAILVCLCLGGWVTDPAHADYRGKDAGTLVVALGSIGQPLNLYQWHYRKLGRASGDATFAYQPHNFLSSRQPDFNGHETGIVQVLHLPPGDYEVYTFNAAGAGYAHSETLRPRKEFSLPFTIKAGEASYIGDFAAVSVAASGPFGVSYTRDIYVVISDQHVRDAEAARKAEPGLLEMTLAVTDVSQLGTPILAAKERD